MGPCCCCRVEKCPRTAGCCSACKTCKICKTCKTSREFQLCQLCACACDHFTAVAWSADSRDCTALSAAVVSRNDLMLHRADRSPQTMTAEHWLADPAGLGPSAVRSGLGQSAVRSDHAAVAGLQTARGRPCAAAHCPLLDSPSVPDERRARGLTVPWVTVPLKKIRKMAGKLASNWRATSKTGLNAH